jgi:leader peptidase (prepilin peptidase) / N-methyltransferase
VEPFVVHLFFVLCAGLAFGSFVTLVSYRLPRGEDIVIKPSRCPSCETRLQFLDLWPVLSWVCSNRCCRHCQAPISVRYPLTELVTAAVFLLLYLKFGFTVKGGILAMMWVALMVMIVVDLEHYIIPDQVHYVLLPLGVLYHAVIGTPPGDAANGFIVGAGIGLALHYGYRILRRKEGLGFGDVKFFAVAGLWLGVKPLVPFMFFSGLFGVATGLIWRALGKGPIFPFGPALALALFLGILFADYVNLFWNIGQIVQ